MLTVFGIDCRQWSATRVQKPGSGPTDAGFERLGQMSPALHPRRLDVGVDLALRAGVDGCFRTRTRRSIPAFERSVAGFVDVVETLAEIDDVLVSAASLDDRVGQELAAFVAEADRSAGDFFEIVRLEPHRGFHGVMMLVPAVDEYEGGQRLEVGAEFGVR